MNSFNIAGVMAGPVPGSGLDLLAVQGIAEPVIRYFKPWLEIGTKTLCFPYLLNGLMLDKECLCQQGRQVPLSRGIWLAGEKIPEAARRLFLFHSALEAMAFCSLRPALLSRPGSCVFAALGLRPVREQAACLLNRFANARWHLVFGTDPVSAILDCKMALWTKGMDAGFRLDQDSVSWQFKSRSHQLPARDFSLNAFQRCCGLRMGLRTYNPPSGFNSFAGLLAKHK